MTGNELMDALIRQTSVARSQTCDGLIAGNGERQVKFCATCFKASAEVIRKAGELGVDTLICHEPVFYGCESGKDIKDPVSAMKWKEIECAGVSVFRYHDYAHEMKPDYIHAGFIRDVPLNIDRNKNYECESLGIRRYNLCEPIEVRSLARTVKESLGLPCVRIAGDANAVISKICLALGSIGINQFRILDTTETELLITGETNEVYCLEYVRDLAFAGNQKAALLLGHYGAEYAGMKLLAEEISQRYVPAVYIDCGEVFECV